MATIGILQIVLFIILILVSIKPLGYYMARVYTKTENSFIERFIYKLTNINPNQEMDWKKYLMTMLCFNFFGILFLYSILRLQNFFPLNPEHFLGVPSDLAWNTAVSFTTNTNWQAYAGESTLSYLTQMFGNTVQNFLSASTGMSLLIAFIRSLEREKSKNLGNYWVDLVRSIIFILLPLSLILAIFLSSQGVIQNLKPYQPVSSITMSNEQVLPMGPVASQIAIKQLGSNGGGFFNTNSAHPYENPTPLTNLFEMLAILLIPTAFCYTFGIMVNDKRQGLAILAAMFIIFLPLSLFVIHQEAQGNPILSSVGLNQKIQSHFSPGGNMEGKELRFGIINSSFWTVATTATSNGSVNSMLDSYTPLGGLVPLWLMHLGCVVFGGVGVGLYSMFMLIILTVFITGLMVGRTPEYLGKKIEPFEMKMATLAVLIMPLIVLVFTAIAVMLPNGENAPGNPSFHGFSEILYAFTSMTNNNGSAFAGLNANNIFYNTLGACAMLIGRYWIAIPVLALGGSLIQKKRAPMSAGSMPTHTFLFSILLVFIILIIGALTFFPALALGPIVEEITLRGYHG